MGWRARLTHPHIRSLYSPEIEGANSSSFAQNKDHAEPLLFITHLPFNWFAASARLCLVGRRSDSGDILSIVVGMGKDANKWKNAHWYGIIIWMHKFPGTSREAEIQLQCKWHKVLLEEVKALKIESLLVVVKNVLRRVQLNSNLRKILIDGSHPMTRDDAPEMGNATKTLSSTTIMGVVWWCMGNLMGLLCKRIHG